MADFACKECHMILEDSNCPRCPESEVSREWQGFVEILNPEKSSEILANPRESSKILKN